MAEKMKKRIVVGATGASGLPLLVKCLEIIREDPDFECRTDSSAGDGTGSE